MRTLAHILSSIIFSVILFFIQQIPLYNLPFWLLWGTFFGIIVDADHPLIALFFDKDMALKDLRTMNPTLLYHDFLDKNGRFYVKSIRDKKYPLYATFHLITIIVTNIVVFIFIPDMAVLTISVTGLHYLTDNMHIIQREN